MCRRAEISVDCLRSQANESAMSEEELANLTYAFQAADMDGGGAIDIEEFSLMRSPGSQNTFHA